MHDFSLRTLRHLQVLALEAFSKRAEKLLQLLAELHRRLQLRSRNADLLSVSASSSTSQGVACRELTAQTYHIKLLLIDPNIQSMFLSEA